MKNYVIFKLILIPLFFFPKSIYAINPPVIKATGNQIYCPGTSLNIVQTITILPDPNKLTTDAVSIQISSGYIFGQDLLILTGTHPTISFNWIPSEGKLKLYTSTGSNVPYADLKLPLPMSNSTLPQLRRQELELFPLI